MMTVDTGAAITMLNSTMFERHFQGIELVTSDDEFITANGEAMTAAGSFRASIQMGPVTIANLKITVADVVGDGLLGMDFLHAADAWLGAREGKFHMKVGDHEVICQLRKEEYRIRRLARPS